jgi:hypothetical protein
VVPARLGLNWSTRGVRADGGRPGRGGLVPCFCDSGLAATAFSCPFPGDDGVGYRYRVHQRAGVRVLRPAEDRACASLFHNVALCENGNVRADLLDYCEVVGNEEDGESEPALHVSEQLEDLGLHRDVERADGFVADENVWLDGEGSGDGNALTLTAGE